MLYHKYSWRRIVEGPFEWLEYRFTAKYDKQRYPRFEDVFNGMFDADAGGRGCPHVEFVSRRDAMRLFGRFASCEVTLENWLTPLTLFGGRITFDRQQCMRYFSRYFGHDAYIVAIR